MRALQKNLALWRKRNITGVAVKQPRANLFFEPADHLAKGRWRHMAALSGHGKAAGVFKRQKGVNQSARQIQ